MDKDFTVSIGKWSYPLIPQADFAEEMPRYPNVWFYISQDYMANYDGAVNVVFGLMQKCGLHDVSWRPPMDGADGEAARDHLQPYDGFSDPGLFHEHSLHLRYYLKPLKNRACEVQGDRIYSCWAIAISVHFEPGGSVHYLSIEEYPELRACPFCGRIDKGVAIVGDIHEKIRDPLGLELLLEGTIRSRRVKDAFGRMYQGLLDLSDAQTTEFIKRIDTKSIDFDEINTPKLGFVLIA